MKNKTMFALTHINRDGMRTLTRRNQGQNHFATEPEAKEYLAQFLKNNSQKTLEDVYGNQAVGTFEIRPVECYDHGDAIGIYFDDPAPAQNKPTHPIKEAEIMLGAAVHQLSEAESLYDVKEDLLELLNEAESAVTGWLNKTGFDNSTSTTKTERDAALVPELLTALENILKTCADGVIQRNETGKPQWCALDHMKKIAGVAIAKAHNANNTFETFLMTDQPPACPKCGARATVIANETSDGRPTNIGGGGPQICLCPACKFLYLLEADDEP